jgi:tetratricopeptide (TPR) repeat protein
LVAFLCGSKEGIMLRKTIGVLFVMLLPALALAQAKGAPGAAAILSEGHVKYLAQDYEGALAKYEQARDKDSGQSIAYYFTGCALARLKRWDDAIAQFKTAATIAGVKDESLHARAIFVAAVTLEQKGDLSGAKSAWEDYQTYAQAHEKAVVYKDSARERIAAIDKKMKLDEDYKIVVERIAKGDQ